MRRIYTIGYEGADIERFIATLSNLKIGVVADVRELPISRKRGFSKNRLANALGAHGIGYRHFRNLGDPKPGRDAARAGEISRFRQIFLAHFYSEEAQAEFHEVIELAKSATVCLLCFERCAIHCHRSIIADAVIANGMEVVNLVADCPDKYTGNEENLPRYRPRQSLPAAE